MANKNNPLAVCPWPGLASYEDPARAETVRLFCGRDKDSEQLSYQIDRELYVTLYGRSGIGKTSLINAGVFPRLRESGYLPLSLRLGRLDEACSYQSFILSSLEQELEAAGCRTEVVDVVAPQEDASATDYLWNYFARHRFFSGDGAPRFPVFVFDQFEEVFSSRPVAAAVLLRQIHYITDETHEIREAHVGGEKYEYDYNFRFVLSIREDDLYKLESCLDTHYLQRLKANRYRLFPMSKEDAREAVLLPAGELIAETEKEAVVETILEIARDKEEGSISTNILSLVCSRIFAQMQKTGQPAISLSLVREFLAGNPFDEFYREVTAGMSSKAKSYMEEHLVDASGRRNSIPAVNFFKKVPDGERLLSGTGRILQRVQVSSEASRIELIHDSFCQPLLDQREKRLRRHRRRTAVLITAIVAVSAAIIGWIWNQNSQLKELDWKNKANQSRFVAEEGYSLMKERKAYDAMLLALDILPENLQQPKRPMVPRAISLLRDASFSNSNVFNHNGKILFARVSDDASLLVTGGMDSLIHLWRIDDGASLGTFSQGGRIKYISFNKNGNKIISSSTDDRITIWSNHEGRWEKSRSWNQPADFVGFDYADRVVSYTEYDTLIHIVNQTPVDTDEVIPFPEFRLYGSDMDLSRDRKWIHAWQFEHGRNRLHIVSLEDHADRIIDVGYKFEGAPYLAEAGDIVLVNGTVYDIKDPEPVKKNIQFDLDNIEVIKSVAANYSLSLIVFKVACRQTEEPPLQLTYSTYYHANAYMDNGLFALDSQPDNERIFMFGHYGKNPSFLLDSDAHLYRVFNGDDGIVIHKYLGGSDEAELESEWIEDENLILLEGIGRYPMVLAKDMEKECLVLFDLEKRTTSLVFDGVDIYDNLSFGFAQYAPRLALACFRNWLDDGADVTVWDTDSQKVLFKKYISSLKHSDSVGLSSEGKAVYVMNGGELQVFDVETGKMRFSFVIDGYVCCAISDARDEMLSVDSKGGLTRRNAQTGEVISVMREDLNAYRVSVSPNGTLAGVQLTNYRWVVIDLDSEEIVMDFEPLVEENNRHGLLRSKFDGLLLGISDSSSYYPVLSMTFLSEETILLSDSQGVFYLIDYLPLQEIIHQQRERFKDNPLTQEERYKYYLD